MRTPSLGSMAVVVGHLVGTDGYETVAQKDTGAGGRPSRAEGADQMSGRRRAPIWWPLITCFLLRGDWQLLFKGNKGCRPASCQKLSNAPLVPLQGRRLHRRSGYAPLRRPFPCLPSGASCQVANYIIHPNIEIVFDLRLILQALVTISGTTKSV